MLLLLLEAVGRSGGGSGLLVHEHRALFFLLRHLAGGNVHELGRVRRRHEAWAARAGPQIVGRVRAGGAIDKARRLAGTPRGRPTETGGRSATPIAPAGSRLRVPGTGGTSLLLLVMVLLLLLLVVVVRHRRGRRGLRRRVAGRRGRQGATHDRRGRGTTTDRDHLVIDVGEGRARLRMDGGGAAARGARPRPRARLGAGAAARGARRAGAAARGARRAGAAGPIGLVRRSPARLARVGIHQRRGHQGGLGALDRSSSSGGNRGGSHGRGHVRGGGRSGSGNGSGSRLGGLAGGSGLGRLAVGSGNSGGSHCGIAAAPTMVLGRRRHV
ncbi:hypothetical protein BC828DRAFT_372263 [Blastocladiella britannica]|nr:hypothetical protein BC828DRAFT_372263 [Blastocladiella britannica]